MVKEAVFFRGKRIPRVVGGHMCELLSPGFAERRDVKRRLYVDECNLDIQRTGVQRMVPCIVQRCVFSFGAFEERELRQFK